MPYDPDQHHRRSIRLENFDYTQAEAYAVTLCVQRHECLLGQVIEGEMRLSEAGITVSQQWLALSSRFPVVDLDAYVIMPNHMHGIVVITGCHVSEGAASSAPTLGLVIRAFKSLSGIACNRVLDRVGSRFWQRNYYEHIVRNEAELDRIRGYISNNPARWSEDTENPDRHL